MKRPGVAILMAAVLCAAAPRDDKPAGDLERLQGDWSTKSFLIDGGPLPKEKQYADRLMTIKGRRSFPSSGAARSPSVERLNHDASKSPEVDRRHLHPRAGLSARRSTAFMNSTATPSEVCIGTPETERPSPSSSRSRARSSGSSSTTRKAKP